MRPAAGGPAARERAGGGSMQEEEPQAAAAGAQAEEGGWLLCAVPDLFFVARIGEIAARHGLRAEVLGSPAALPVALAQEPGPRCFVVDCHMRDGDPIALIRQAKEIAPAIPVIAFAPHVARDLLERARRAGADRAVANSQLSRALLEALRPRRGGAEARRPTP